MKMTSSVKLSGIKRAAAACLIAMNLVTGLAQGIVYKTDPATGAIDQLAIDHDDQQMNWVLTPDGKQYKWVTGKYGWGLGFLTIDGAKQEWQTPVSRQGGVLTYQAGTIRITVKRTLKDGELFEEYTFKNTGKAAAKITDWGIYTPWNDNYPDAATCMTHRCNAHIWAGDNAAYVLALRMGYKGTLHAPGKKGKDVTVEGTNVGLVLTKGALPDYEEWERKKENANSNFRGVIAMDLPDMTLGAGHSYTVAWKLFEHSGREDFYKKLLAAGSAVAHSDKYVYQQGEEIKVYLEKNKLKSLSATLTGKDPRNGTVTFAPRAIHTGKDARGHYASFVAETLGEQRIDLTYDKTERTHATILVISSYDELIAKRVRFVMEHQQMNDPQDPRFGAYMVYDNDLQAIYKNDDARKSYDCDEGRERVGMGVMLARWYQKLACNPSAEASPADKQTLKELKQSLTRYADFIKNKLQTPDYTTYSRVSKDGWNRGYNYAWVADFYFQMYEVTKNAQYALDGYKTLQALYRHTGYGFYCIDIPVTAGLKALKDAGLQAEYNDLLIDFSKTADVFLANGLRFPKSEVNFEQSIVAPATQLLLEMYIATKDSLYLRGAQNMMPVVENLCGNQPDYRLNEIPIRHWDCYWFGKRQVFGDTFPHYWSCINANVYYYYALATGDKKHMKMAKDIVRNNHCNVFEDGTGSCAFVYPKRINGERAHFADAFANDQDWALAFYMMINK